MKRKHSTKRSLIASLLVLCICVTSFIGTTYAWFTDSVTSSGNIIKSGTLDVTMEWAKGTEDPGTTAWTDASTSTIFNYDKWEPGYAEARHIKISNVGSLALKYAVNIIPDGTVSDLADVIDVYYADPAVQVANRDALAGLTKIGTLTDVLANMGSTATGNLAAESSDVITLVLKMQESAGNEYQNKSIGTSFSIQLVAAQDTVEIDSFDKLYDAAAPFYGSTYSPAPAPGASAIEVDVLNDKNSKIGSIVIPAGAFGEGATETVVNINETNFYDPATNSNFTIAAGLEMKAFDLHISNLKADNSDPVKVSLYIGQNFDPATVQVYHRNALVANANYNFDTGYVTFETTSFSPFAVVYDEESVYQPPVVDGTNVPVANVEPITITEEIVWGSYGQWSPTEGLDAELESVYKFSCTQSYSEALASGYADWECDFFVKLNRDLGENQIFLGGNYGSFGWVGFHNGDVTLAANEEIPLLGSVTSNPWTYADVVNFVGEFICGVGDVDNALSGATFTVSLRLTNPQNGETIDVAVINHTFN